MAILSRICQGSWPVAYAPYVSGSKMGRNQSLRPLNVLRYHAPPATGCREPEPAWYVPIHQACPITGILLKNGCCQRSRLKMFTFAMSAAIKMTGMLDA